MLDTGAADSGLLTSSGERFGYTPTRKGVGAVMVEGGPASQWFNAIYPSFAFVGLSGRPVRIGLLSAKDLNRAFESDGEKQCDGLLGAPLLHAYSAVIDYSAGKLYLLDPWVKEKGLLGTWVCVRADDGTAERTDDALAAIRLDVRAGEMTLHADRKRDFHIVLDPSTPQRRLEWIDKKDGVTRHLIYKLEGDKLTIAGGLWKPSQAYPAKFTATKDATCVVLEFKRKKLELAPPPRPAPAPRTMPQPVPPPN